MKKILIGLALALTACCISGPSVHAATLDDVMAQLQAMQRDNQAIRHDNEAMRKEIAALRRDRTQPRAPTDVSAPARSRNMPRSAFLAMAAAPAGGSYYKAAPVAGPYDWSGFYAGLNAGYAFGKINTAADGFGAGSSDHDGFFGGGQIGYNWQYSALVFGVEADIQGAAIGGSQTVLDLQGGGAATESLTSKMDAFGTVRARVGYTFDRVLLYGTGGFAAGRNTITNNELAVIGGGSTIAATFSDTALHTGWTAGGGIEYGLRDGWSVKGEYLHVDFGIKSLLLNNVHSQFQYDLVRAGINYHFN